MLRKLIGISIARGLASRNFYRSRASMRARSRGDLTTTRIADRSSEKTGTSEQREVLRNGRRLYSPARRVAVCDYNQGGSAHRFRAAQDGDDKEKVITLYGDRFRSGRAMSCMLDRALNRLLPKAADRAAPPIRGEL
jgi:hypothetical protein